MDETSQDMVLTAYDETYHEALNQGQDEETAEREAEVAAAMCLAAVLGIEDEQARAYVREMNIKKLLEAMD